MPDTTPVVNFAPLAGLQARHLSLLKTAAHELSDDATADVTAFIADVVAAGRVLDAADDRALAQELINFWVARLSLAARKSPGKADPPGVSYRDSLLAPFKLTVQQMADAAHQWTATVPDDDQLLSRLFLRLVRLRPGDAGFEPVPAVRAALQDLDPTPERVDRLLAELQRVGAVRILRAPAGEPPTGDRVSLRDPGLMTAWADLARSLDVRAQFRLRANEWARGETPGSPPSGSWFGRMWDRIGRARMAGLEVLGRWTDLALATARRRLGWALASGPLTSAEIDTALTFHDRTPEERRFIEHSRRWEERRNQSNRALLALLALISPLLLVAVLLLWWALENEKRFNAKSLEAKQFEAKVSEKEDEVLKWAREAKESDEQNDNLKQILTALRQRPALLVCRNQISDTVPDVWGEGLRAKAAQISTTCASTGKIYVQGDPDLNWVGTGFVVRKDVVITPASQARVFLTEASGGGWNFRTRNDGKGLMSASINFAAEACGSPAEEFAITEVLFVGDRATGQEVALLRTAPLGAKHPPLPLTDKLPATVDKLLGRSVYVVGHHAKDTRLPKEVNELILGDLSDVKRLAPGKLILTENNLSYPKNDGNLGNDCTTMGGSGGGPLVDLESGMVIGMSFAGVLGGHGLKENYPLLMWDVLNDPQVKSKLPKD